MSSGCLSALDYLRILAYTVHISKDTLEDTALIICLSPFLHGIFSPGDPPAPSGLRPPASRGEPDRATNYTECEIFRNKNARSCLKFVAVLLRGTKLKAEGAHARRRGQTTDSCSLPNHRPSAMASVVTAK